MDSHNSLKYLLHIDFNSLYQHFFAYIKNETNILLLFVYCNLKLLKNRFQKVGE